MAVTFCFGEISFTENAAGVYLGKVKEGGYMSRNKAQTHKNLIDPKIFELGWTNDLIRGEVTPGGTDIVDDKPVRLKGRTEYLLCLPILEGQLPLPKEIERELAKLMKQSSSMEGK
jgi:hypothetical protein